MRRGGGLVERRRGFGTRMRAQTWSLGASARAKVVRAGEMTKWQRRKGPNQEERGERGGAERGEVGWRQTGERDADAKGACRPLGDPPAPPGDLTARCGLRPAGRVVVGHRDRRADLGGTSAACSWCHRPLQRRVLGATGRGRLLAWSKNAQPARRAGAPRRRPSWPLRCHRTGGASVPLRAAPDCRRALY
jgi:hypothetical protein